MAPGDTAAATARKVVVIDNPVLNSPFDEPKRHFRFTDDGITDEIVDQRRISSYFVPIPSPKKKGKQLQFDTEWVGDRIKENEFINKIRAKVSRWREADYFGPAITKVTRQLLDYWKHPDRERRLFFCQIEALETAIYITEVASKHGDAWIDNAIKEANDNANPLLQRVAFKMATGSGKTVVMAMLIAWHTLNKIVNPQDSRFSDVFLIVTPGITIRDRLRVLLPNDPQNYYKVLDIVPPERRPELEQAKIIITNFHGFLAREKVQASKLTKSILKNGKNNGAFTETPDEMVRRVCRELGSKRNIIIINDEAHHCYRSKPDGLPEEKLRGEERKEAERRDKEARVWISGLEAVKAKLGIRAIYDLSATPFFLRGSGYREGTLFPWVVADFSLIDAIESGVVKIPRVPIADDSMTGPQPTYRDLWQRIRTHLPRKSRKQERLSEQSLPAELQGAILSLYDNYEKYYRLWKNDTKAREAGLTPPVFIVVCNNTSVSKLVFDYIAGREKTLPNDVTLVVPGNLPLFNNEQNGSWSVRPNTILIDSQQLESGEAMSSEFKRIAAREIEEFKADYRRRFPGRDIEKVSDEDLLREVMNTVGKSGKLGEQIKCVVSVSMLTEGWDANTVTHILGVRAFGTQLLCEQVIGRGLRRMSYVPDDRGMFQAEYAEVYGVPFSFIPTSGSGAPRIIKVPTRVRALEERIACEITFPRLVGYRYDLPKEKLTARFTDESCLALSTADVPTKTENAPIVGETSIHTLDDLKQRRLQEVAFLLAKLTLEKYFRQDGGMRRDRSDRHSFDAEVQSWVFPQLLGIAKQWLDECVTCKDNTFPQLLLLLQFAHDAADRIYQAIVRSTTGEKKLMPIPNSAEGIGSTCTVDFDTYREVYVTRPDKCHVSHVVADSSWEPKLAQTLEDMDEVVCYVKNNRNLGFQIPYTINGEERNYESDYIVRIHLGDDSTLNLIVEVTGERKKDKAAKAATAETLWVPAVNNCAQFGRWAYVEISDPWDAKNAIRHYMTSLSSLPTEAHTAKA